MESPICPRPEPGLTLIETLGWDGAGFPRLDRHLARLARSAALLGWTCDPDAARLALQSAAPDPPARMRLTLDATGQITVTASALPAALPLWKIGLAPQRLTASDPWLRLKSSHRLAYDAARAALPAGLDEVILLNERDEVCDGSITTIFFDAGQGLCTPPQSCGLLPGVLREELLQTGQAREAVLMVQDLSSVKLWVGNSLRGLSAAKWLG
ncbi:aminotransferase class IV family protein [Rhodobacter ferrooxidans]|uniref:Probable branched-chain-amino-acid aminotransferase n=1 Tax=Rhodobacter ferrooxidans TaxID=371731 RepID=C8S399_9RHOB|nr:aminotransferase class IV family protein [Rhodobacter sp. SW2]EEW24581.1 aminotransferase class IV [Rhodobacter sp. SW2]